MIISKESSKTSFSIDNLLIHNFFNDFVTKNNIDVLTENLHICPEISGKVFIQQAIQKFESRLKEEQKLVSIFTSTINLAINNI